MKVGLTGVRILATGGSGFLGRALCTRLVAGGAEVHVLARSRRPESFPANRWWRGDVADPSTVSRLVDELEPSGIFHLAGRATGAPDRALMREMLGVHVMGTANVLDAAAQLSRPPFVVLVGSMAEPGPGGQELAASPYAATKAAAAGVAEFYAHICDVPVVRARLFMVYGPGDTQLTKAVPHLMLATIRNERPRFGAGVLPLDWTFIDDAVDGLLAAAFARPTARVDIGTGRLATLREIVGIVSELSQTAVEPQYGAMVDRPFVTAIRADTEQAARHIEWRAKVGLEDGLSRTFEWFRSAWAAGEFAPGGAG